MFQTEQELPFLPYQAQSVRYGDSFFLAGGGYSNDTNLYFYEPEEEGWNVLSGRHSGGGPFPVALVRESNFPRCTHE